MLDRCHHCFEKALLSEAASGVIRLGLILRGIWDRVRRHYFCTGRRCTLRSILDNFLLCLFTFIFTICHVSDNTFFIHFVCISWRIYRFCAFISLLFCCLSCVIRHRFPTTCSLPFTKARVHITTHRFLSF